MHYHIIEIGTSDFRIDSLESSKACLLIEPSQFYLNNITDKENITKLQCAISNVDGIVDFYETNLKYIEEHNLHNWLRGCNSIHKMHPTVKQYAIDNNININDLVTKNIVSVLSFKKLVQLFEIESIHYLKIDTEGHDNIILSALLNTNIRPNIIKFESNELTNEEEYNKIIEILKKEYIVNRFKDDTILIKL